MNENELGQTHLVLHETDIGDTLPIKFAPHRLAPGKITVVKKEIEDMVARNIIRPSNSPYSAPIVLVTKKDGSNRMCTDFRRLNVVTNKDAFPLPRIDQILDHLHGATIFSSLDPASGYWQVPLAESAIPKTAFVIPDGGPIWTLHCTGNLPATYDMHLQYISLLVCPHLLGRRSGF